MALNKEQLDGLVGLVFGTIVKHLRNKRNQTRGPFAVLIGLSPEELEWLEDGTEASVTTLYRLGETLGVSAARLAAATQLTVNRIHERADLAAALKAKDWAKAVSIIEKALEHVHDLLKLPPPEQMALSLPAPGPRMSNEVYTVQPSTEKPMQLTRIVDAEDEDEPEGPFDDEFDDDAEEEDDDATESSPSRVGRPPRPQPPMPEVVVKPSTGAAGQGVQRRGPGRPRKYPVPPA